ncbi:hypothetical protein A4S06_10515 [Erysipelotrichaceae bacterium MTC7]|nr:hypothetical protein A4S06_10515 [Erysipelotrichaceae bacterium MTC7]
MENLRKILVAILGVLIFIWLIPVFAWLFVLICIVGLVIYIYYRYRIRKMMNDDEYPYYRSKDAYEDERDDASGSRIDPDVIDVEYTEREDE